MNNYQLTNYNLSGRQAVQSLFLSEYGLRHLAQSKTDKQHKWGHRMIALIELCPGLGLIVSAIEFIAAKYIQFNNRNRHTPPPPPIIEQEWLFRGTQVPECNGDVDLSQAVSICQELNQHYPSGIQFDPNKIAKNIEGGTCTAMSLKFADSYFKGRQICRQQKNHQSNILAKMIVELEANFAKSCKEMRTRQAAYNTIEIIPPQNRLNRRIDHSKNKVQALANHHFLKIKYCSKEIEVDQLRDPQELSETVDQLQNGVFLVRIIKPEDNHKLEESGHSLIYIKEKDAGFFYDPNFGVRNLRKGEHSQILFNGFKECFNSFQIRIARFYELEPQSFGQLIS